MTLTIRFWRLQEVEVPICDGRTVDDVKQAFKDIKNNDAASIFDFDGLVDWSGEEVINEDYSGLKDYFAIVQDDEQVGGSKYPWCRGLNYRTGVCETFHYVSLEEIARRESIIDRIERARKIR